MNAGTMCFQCPICQDTEQFRAEMSTLGIQIPVRLVSFSPALQMGRRERRACPGTVPAGLALCCLTSIGLSFTEKLEMGLPWMDRDTLDHTWQGTGGSLHSLPSLVGDHLGGMTTPTHRFYRGTGAATSASAFTQEAGSRKRWMGELPQQPSGLLQGISASTPDGEPGLSTADVPATAWLGSLCPHGHNPFASPGPGSCSSAAPVLQKGPTDDAPT